MTTIVIKTQTHSSAGGDTDVLEGFEDSEDLGLTNSGTPDEKKYLTDEENSEVVLTVDKIAKKYKKCRF